MTQPAAPTDPQTLDAAKKIAAQIQKESGVSDMTKLPIGDHVVWYPWPGYALENGQAPEGCMFKLLQPVPFKTVFSVFALFADEDEYRVYTVPNATASHDPQKQEQVLRCYHLSKAGPHYHVDNLTLDAFITMVASEWSVMAYGLTTVESERASIAGFLRAELSSGTSLSDLADLIESGEYDLDDEDEPEPAPGSPSPSADKPS